LGGAKKNEQKLKNRDGLEVPNKSMRATMEGVIGVYDESSSEETPNSVAKTTRPMEKKQTKAKGKKTDEDDLENSMEAIV
jgi:hypothetical protein